ncbi:MAG TPA: hypothetical protein VM327_08040 [Candidatus Thermoplasmatota archaeon]|nr:hypothetical protein [Candidatus Thermoplasmatota archaeon]
MRWLPATLAILVAVSGCSSPGPKDTPSAVMPDDVAMDAQTDLNGTAHRMVFAGGDQEASLSFELTFGPTDPCLFAASLCSHGLQEVDLTPAVPAEVPVGLTVELTGPGNYDLSLVSNEATVVRYEEDYSSGTWTIDAILVRGSSGTLTLTVQYVLPSVESAQGVTLAGRAHSSARGDVVPAYIPVAVELRPGDVINATGDGLTQFVVFPPEGAPLRAVAFPFGLRVPDTYPAGTYFVVADADEAIRMTGPDRPLSARAITYTRTEPLDVVPGQETTWEMAVPGHPLNAGVVLESKPTSGDLSLASFPGNFKARLTSPENVDVIAVDQPCTPAVDCGIVLAGHNGYSSPGTYLDEHLVPGTYLASMTMENGHDMRAYSWAISVQ